MQKTSKLVVVVVWIDFGKKYDKIPSKLNAYLNMADFLTILKTMLGITWTKKLVMMISKPRDVKNLLMGRNSCTYRLFCDKMIFSQNPPIYGKFSDFSKKHIRHYINQILCLWELKIIKIWEKSFKSTNFHLYLKNNSKPYIFSQYLPIYGWFSDFSEKHVGHYIY